MVGMKIKHVRIGKNVTTKQALLVAWGAAVAMIKEGAKKRGSFVISRVDDKTTCNRFVMPYSIDASQKGNVTLPNDGATLM
ncbi:hypothetical protein HPP92_028317 [Vanilla planifolia]|uniref:Uncharacterized protein n=1 Tax=Vanilla planifolia TaxID=51239 RepID=A0A835P8A3_VANPL|nr:hypothetical protein HPP92_028317 [Vanilla planifolia]